MMQIYSTYKKENPDCTISEKVLKSHIRAEKIGLKTGDFDDASSKLSFQPSEMLEKIKAGNPHAKRNLLAQQERIMNSISNKEHESQNGSTPSALIKKSPKPKAQTLIQQADSIDTISENYAQSRQTQEDLMKTSNRSCTAAEV